MENIVGVDYSKKWLVMAAVACEVFLSTIDGSIVNIALNTLVEQLHQPLAVVEWVVLVYLLVIATLMLSIGRLADMFGKKKLFATGLAIFTIGSALCGLSPNIYWLITSRVIQAVGASMNMALSTAIVTEAFPSQERGKALGIIGLLVSLGVIAGPTLGGIILQYLTWHWLFFVNLPIGVIGFFMVLRFVPEIKPKGDQKFDFWGAGTLFVGMASFLLALSFIQTDGFQNLLVYVLLVFAVAMIALFIKVENKASEPMIDLHLFTNRLFSINLITCFITFVASAGVTLLIPLYLQNVMGFDPQKTGILMIISPLAMAVVAPLSGAISDRVGSRVLTTIGLVICLTGYIAFINLNAQTSTISYILSYAAIGTGMGIFQSPNNSTIMGEAPKHRLGVASGLLSLTRVLGQTAGISILGALWEANVFRFAGKIQVSDATQAPIWAQVAGLHDAMLFIVIFILVAVFLSAWALITVQRAKNHPKQNPDLQAE
jgi:EmrB/QacA subfamily drug resistance transporter